MSELEAAGARLIAAELERKAAMEAFAAAVRAAHGSTPITELARSGGVSRPTIYALLSDRA